MLRFVLIALLLAVAVYLLVRLLQRRTAGPALRPQQPGRRTIAPDDDDQFLRDLDQDLRKPEDPEGP